MDCKTPILLITFNRPEHTRRTIEALRVQQPPLVYVFQDGARTGNVTDAERCQQVREVIEKEIDWKCELHTHFSEKNRGCRDAIIYAISSVLKEHESVIVVEDDIITSPAFYTYMCKALDYYRNRPTVWSISGHSHSPEKFQVPEDYDYDVFASPRLFNWGWGTWRDRWKRTDWTMSYYDELLRHPYEMQAFSRGGDDLIPMLMDEKMGRSSAWDIQFAFAHFANHAVSIVPCASYTANIGQDGSGTHSSIAQTKCDINALNQNTQPKFIDNLYFDSRILNRMYSVFARAKRPLWQRAINYIYRKLGKQAPFVVKKKIYY
jgi:hypothetical protein